MKIPNKLFQETHSLMEARHDELTDLGEILQLAQSSWRQGTRSQTVALLQTFRSGCERLAKDSDRILVAIEAESDPDEPAGPNALDRAAFEGSLL